LLTILASQKGNWVIVLTDSIIEEHEKRLKKEEIKGARKIDPARLQWKPPVFTASSRTWNW
jgi:histone acetyltransferase HTATIP